MEATPVRDSGSAPGSYARRRQVEEWKGTPYGVQLPTKIGVIPSTRVRVLLFTPYSGSPFPETGFARTQSSEQSSKAEL